jgi:cation:H+ antiporter
MHGLSTGYLFAIAIIALVTTLAASEVLVRGVGRLAQNLGLLGGIVGLVIALGADSPEISSAVAATANGSAATGIGVVLGSNMFNIAVLLGFATLAAGKLRVHWSAVALDAGIAIAVTLALGATMLAVLPLAIAWILLLCFFAPYVVFLGLRPDTVGRLRVPAVLRAFLLTASREAVDEGGELEAELEEHGVGRSQPRSWRPTLLAIPAVIIIAVSSVLLVQSALDLGQRWALSDATIGVVVLAAATSLPNAYAAVRLAIDERGTAVVSATFNSNTLNLIAGFAIPAVFLHGIHASVPLAYIAWLVAMSVLALILLARGLRRPGALLLLAGYASFVTYAVLTG